MKFNYLIKASPFLSILLLIFFLTISNQKEYTKLRILIWNTPSLKLGTYLAISTGSGFVLSYLITTNLSKVFKSHQKEALPYREQNSYQEIENATEPPSRIFYDNTLIERDIKDPSPTIDANFRIIGRRETTNNNRINNNIQKDDSIRFEEHYDEQGEINEAINQPEKNRTDWYDESYSRW